MNSSPYSRFANFTICFSAESLQQVVFIGWQTEFGGAVGGEGVHLQVYVSSREHYCSVSKMQDKNIKGKKDDE